MHLKFGRCITFLSLLLLSASVIFGAAKLRLLEQREEIVLQNAADCTAFLLQHGIAVCQPPIALERIRLPAVYNDTYEAYLRLQEEQGLSLRVCAGEPAQLYIYEDAADHSLLVTLIVCDDKLVAADISSCENGGMRPLWEMG